MQNDAIQYFGAKGIQYIGYIALIGSLSSLGRIQEIKREMAGGKITYAAPEDNGEFINYVKEITAEGNKLVNQAFLGGGALTFGIVGVKEAWQDYHDTCFDTAKCYVGQGFNDGLIAYSNALGRNLMTCKWYRNPNGTYEVETWAVGWLDWLMR